MTNTSLQAAIVDYGICNMFSVLHACVKVGLDAEITSDRHRIQNADLVILPGVGAFGDAMEALERLDLVGLLRDTAQSNTPLVGICLGMQLLMESSDEFGRHNGLGILKGCVKKFLPAEGAPEVLRVPHIGWNTLTIKNQARAGISDLYHLIPDQSYFYFVHSFYAVPEDVKVIAAETEYGNYRFCSSMKWGNNAAFQFHPERSGPLGLQLYENLKFLCTSPSSSTPVGHS